MATRSLAGIVINLTAKTSQFIQGIEKARKKTNRFRKAMFLANAAANLASQAFVGAARALGRFTKAAFAGIDNLAKTADNLGLTTKQLAGYRLAAEQSGLSTQELDKSIMKLNKSIGEGSFKSSEAAFALEAIGLSQEKLMQMNTSDRLLAVRDALDNVKGSATKTAIAQDLLGRGGTKMLKFFELSTEQLKEFGDAAEQRGIAPTREAALRVEAFNDALNLLKKTFVGLGMTIATELSDPLKDATESLDGFINGLRKIGIGTAISAGLDQVSADVNNWFAKKSREYGFKDFVVNKFTKDASKFQEAADQQLLDKIGQYNDKSSARAKAEARASAALAGAGGLQNSLQPDFKELKSKWQDIAGAAKGAWDAAASAGGKFIDMMSKKLDAIVSRVQAFGTGGIPSVAAVSAGSASAFGQFRSNTRATTAKSLQELVKMAAMQLRAEEQQAQEIRNLANKIPSGQF